MIKKKKKILSKKEKSALIRKVTFFVILSLIVSAITFVSKKTVRSSVIAFFVVMVILSFGSKVMNDLKKSDRIKKIENVFPDFLQLVSSNLRAGMTVDRAMLVSARPEFAPLDKEIFQAGKDISTGKPIGIALKAMGDRIGSENVEKTLLIILSGIKAGGNLAVLLDETSSGMRQRVVVAKKSASQVMMYVIFIFIAVAIAAPALFALSGVLVGTLNDMMAGVTPDSVPSNLPISFSSISISENFIHYFSIIFVIVMNIMASMTIGLVNKGNEKEGLRMLPVMLILSLSIFFALGKILSSVMASFSG